MAARNLDKYVRRYTNLASVIDTLANRRLVLLNPSKWDDGNDVQFMEWYGHRAQVGSLLALCCTMSSETYHHWRVFTEGMNGVCIEFDRERLEQGLRQIRDIRFGAVEYLLIRQLKQKSSAAYLPFVKRDGFSDEREYRIIGTTEELGKQTMEIPLELGCVSKLIFNPWLPPSLAETLRKTIRRIDGCGRLPITASKLTNSAEWKAAGRHLA